MPLTLNLPPELEQRLTQEARRRGFPPDACTLQLLDEHLPPSDQRLELVSRLQEWIDEDDPAEQHETGEDLVQSLDENRLSDRKLFPPERKGVTW